MQTIDTVPSSIPPSPIQRLWSQLSTLPRAIWAVYGLAAYVILSSLYELLAGIQERIATQTLMLAGATTDPFYELGTSLGFWGMIYFCLNFLLATRWRWVERLFGGLDQVYKLHGQVGKIALTMILLHLAILVLQAAPNLELITSYLLPGIDIAYTLGLFGVLLLTVLVALTIWIRLPYHRWLQSHKWMGVPYVLGGLHAIVLQGDWYMILLTIIGGWAWLYNLFFYERMGPQQQGKIVSNVQKGNINELLIALNHPMRVQPGQFIFLSIQKSVANLPKEQHAFSVSQIVDDRTLRISAKTLGDYTSRLRDLHVDDEVTLFGPYGTFGARHQAAKGDIVCIAGGIGITPFLSMLHAERGELDSPARTIHLLWSVKSRQDAVYHDELEELQQLAPHIRYRLHQSTSDGQLTSHTIRTITEPMQLSTATIFLCGPQRMIHTLKKELIQQGVPQRNIISEDFAFR